MARRLMMVALAGMVLLPVGLYAEPPSAPKKKMIRVARRERIGMAERVLANGIEEYREGKLADAVMRFYPIVRGQKSLPPRVATRAEFWLGRTLFDLRLLGAAFGTFKSVAVDAEKAQDMKRLSAAFKWMVRINDELKNDAEFHEFFARFPEPLQLSAVRSNNRLIFLLAERAYETGRLEEAVRLFRAVSRKSALYLHSLYYLGVIIVRQGQPSRAIRFFQEIEKIILKADPKRFENLLTLSRIQIARLYYQLNYFAEALDYFKKVPRDSDYWARTQFEIAWANFRYGRPGEALGNLWSYRSPFLKDFYEPEILILEAIITFSLCQFEEADQRIEEVFKKYSATSDTIRKLLSRPIGHDRFFRVFVEPGSRANLGLEVPTPIIEAVLDQKQFLEEAFYVRRLEEETAQVKVISEAFARSSLARAIEQRARKEIQEATVRAAEMARQHVARLQRKTDYFREIGYLIKFEAVSSQKSFLEAQIRAPLVEGRPQYQVIEGVDLVDGSFNWWEFDREWWRDELGSYKVKLDSLCDQMADYVGPK